MRLEDNVGRLRSEVIAAALDWYEWEAAHAPDGGPDDPHDLRLYQLLADPAVRAVLARYREARR